MNGTNETVRGCTPLREACLSTVAEGNVWYVFAPVPKTRKPHFTVEPWGGAPASRTYQWLLDNGLIRKGTIVRSRSRVELTKLGERVHRGEVYWSPA